MQRCKLTKVSSSSAVSGTYGWTWRWKRGNRNDLEPGKVRWITKCQVVSCTCVVSSRIVPRWLGKLPNLRDSRYNRSVCRGGRLPDLFEKFSVPFRTREKEKGKRTESEWADHLPVYLSSGRKIRGNEEFTGNRSQPEGRSTVVRSRCILSALAQKGFAKHQKKRVKGKRINEKRVNGSEIDLAAPPKSPDKTESSDFSTI